jgi:multiple sugar transport system substrate-binding protein
MASKKVLTSFLVLLLAFGALLGCSKSGGKASPSNSATASGSPSASATQSAAPSESAKPEPVTIVVSGYPQETDTAGRAQWALKIKKFNEKYPDVTIKPDPWQYNNQEFAVKMAGKSAPDIITLFATEGRIVAERGWAANLTDYINNWDKGKDYNTDAFKAFTIDGKIYGLPDWQYVMNILYNKKMFKDKNVPEPNNNWTWDDFVNAAKKLTDKSKGIAGLGLPGKGGEATWVWSNFLYQAGGEAEAQKDSKWLSVANSDAGVKALQLYKDLRWTDDVLQPNISAGGGDINKDFGNGKIAMITHGDWVVSQMLNEYKMKLQDIGIAAMPSMTAGGPHSAVSGGGFTIINGQITDKNKMDAAWNWVTFDRLTDDGIASEEKQISESKAKGEKVAAVTISPALPGSDYAVKQKAMWDKYPDTKIQWPDELYSTLLKDAHFEPSIDGQAWYGAIAPAIEKVLTSKGADPKAELDKAAKTFQSQTLDNYKN